MSVELTQKGRLLTVKTPLADDVLLPDRMSLNEGLSQLFVLHLELIAPVDKAGQVDSESLLGQPMTLSVALAAEGKKRHVNGIVSRFSAGPRDARVATYRAEIVPQLWLLSLKSNCRVFQDKAVPDILKEVLKGLDVEYNLGNYRTIDYCVQYRETDFNFVSRLMEQEGIYYYFKHEEDKHTLVITDSPDKHGDVPTQAKVRHAFEAKKAGGEDLVSGLNVRRSMVTGLYTMRDYNFQTPDQTLEYTEIAANIAGGNDKLELFDYPGEYAQRFNKPDQRMSEMFQEGPALTKFRIQEAEADFLTGRGASTCRAFLPGFKFELLDAQDNPLDVDKAGSKYLITSVEHSAGQSPAYFSGGSGGPYSNTFTCIPAAAQYRPSRQTPKPVVQGLQSALVVGTKGQEIDVDKYGRVKVQFHWDRYGKKDENSSCWVRVGQASAGTQWGSFFWPRIGHEVLVAFLEGDPDAPIIVGSVYNYNNMPPYVLPDNKTRSGIKTRSTLKGTSDTFNELRFEDKKGSEEIYVHAERDMNRVVENNDTVKIGFSDKDKGDQTTEIFNNQTYKVGADGCADGTQTSYIWNNHDMLVGAGGAKAADGSQILEIWNNQEVTIGSGSGQNSDGSQIVSIWKDRVVTIQTGNDDVQIDKGNRTATISMGNDSLNIKMGNQTTKLDLGASSTEAMQAIELKVGQSSIKIDQTGVTIKGIMVKVEGTAMTQVKAPMTQINGDGMLIAKGGLTMIN